MTGIMIGYEDAERRRHIINVRSEQAKCERCKREKEHGISARGCPQHLLINARP